MNGLFSKNFVRLLANLWPPFLAAGIGIDSIGDGYRDMQVSMTLRWYNRNYVGTHFGGSMYAMVDPFYMLMLIQNLGRDYIVWDKAAFIDFKKPGTGRITAKFHLSKEFIEEVRLKSHQSGKYVFDIPVEIKNEAGEVVAEVKKTLYVRYKLFKG
ncbi:MAG: DUF4442 domain-containing protein [Bdellovibrionota bacterium]